MNAALGTLSVLAASAIVVGLIGFVRRADPSPAADAVRAEARSSVSADAARAPASAADEVHVPASEPPTVRVLGLMVNAPTCAATETMDDLAFLGTYSRTRVALELSMPAGGLVDLLREESELALFADDRNTDLRDTGDLFGPFEWMPRVAADARSMVFVVGSGKLPAAGAARLRVKGNVSVLVATETETYESERLRLRPGIGFSLGTWDFEVVESGPSDWNEGRWAVTLRTEQDPGTVVSWSLADEDDKRREWMLSATMEGGGEWQLTLECDGEVEAARVGLEVWKEPRTVRVPFDVSAGMGLR